MDRVKINRDGAWEHNLNGGIAFVAIVLLLLVLFCDADISFPIYCETTTVLKGL